MASNTSRMGSGLNQTPKSSPHSKALPSRSPAKISNTELHLKLKKTIGTTANSNRSFSHLENTRRIAYTAGAVAVVGDVNDDCTISQRFFLVRPASQPLRNTTPSYDLSSPTGTSQGLRVRTINRSRDNGNANSYFTLPTKESVESPSGRKGSTREKAKAMTCVSLSPDGRFLAVGETGHKPRVLVFITDTDDSTNFPVTALTEHSFGVRCVAFSSDSQYLATMGELNDGFLHVWSIDNRTGSATLYASNKCINNVRKIMWLGKSLITFGTRHIKIWRIETAVSEPISKKPGDISLTYMSDSGKALAGRNCLLGPLLDQTFTDALPISADRAAVCSERGDICLFIDHDVSPQIIKIAESGFIANAMALEPGERLIIGGSSGMAFQLNDLLNISTNVTQQKLMQGAPWCIAKVTCHVSAMAFIQGRLITLNSQMMVNFFRIPDLDQLGVLAVPAFTLEAHASAIPGLQVITTCNRLAANFFTWSVDGLVLFWTYGGTCERRVRVTLDNCYDGTDYINELRVVRLCRNSEYIVSGDRFGRMKVIQIASEDVFHDEKVHLGEIMDVAVHEAGPTTLIATCGRDRMIQIYRWTSDRFELVQTLDEHVGSVHRVLFNKSGTILISCASDRNIVVWDIVIGPEMLAFLKSRSIVLKSTPLSIAFTQPHDETLLVSTNDKQINKYDMRLGSLLSRFKLSGADGGDPIAMSALTQVSRNEADCVVAGVSNTDKSVRAYDQNGRLLACEYGHTEGLTGIINVQHPRLSRGWSLATTGADGTIFLWELSRGDSQLKSPVEMDVSENMVDSGNATAPTNRTPLRRVLSSSKVARLQQLRAVQESRESNGYRALETSESNRKPSKPSFSQTPYAKYSTEKHPLDSQTRAYGQSHDRKGWARSSAVSPANVKEQSVAKETQSSTPGAQETPSPRKSTSTTAATTELKALVLATEQVCRNLHNYRKKLSATNNVLPVENVRDLERELSLTAKAIAERAARSKTAMVNLLDEYSERLVGLLDEKIEASVARQIDKKTQNDN